MPKTTTMKWTEGAQLDLAILALSQAKSLRIDVDEILQAWPAERHSQTPTPRAVQERLKALKKRIPGAEAPFSVGAQAPGRSNGVSIGRGATGLARSRGIRGSDSHARKNPSTNFETHTQAEPVPITPDTSIENDDGESIKEEINLTALYDTSLPTPAPSAPQRTSPSKNVGDIGNLYSNGMRKSSTANVRAFTNNTSSGKRKRSIFSDGESSAESTEKEDSSQDEWPINTPSKLSPRTKLPRRSKSASIRYTHDDDGSGMVDEAAKDIDSEEEFDPLNERENGKERGNRRRARREEQESDGD